MRWNGDAPSWPRLYLLSRKDGNIIMTTSSVSVTVPIGQASLDHDFTTIKSIKINIDPAIIEQLH